MPRRFGEAKEVPGEAGDPGMEGGCNFAARGGGRVDDEVYGYIGGAFNGDFNAGIVFRGDPTFFVLTWDSYVFSFDSILVGLKLTCFAGTRVV